MCPTVLRFARGARLPNVHFVVAVTMALLDKKIYAGNNVMPLKNWAKKMAIKVGYFISHRTTEDELKSFFETIQPIVTEKELIRVGGPSDGGYLIPDDLDGVESCFSPGVGSKASFEKCLAEKNIRSFLVDHSVSGPPFQNTLFKFDKKFLGAKNDKVFIRLEDWVSKYAPQSQNLILQMDIEGGEYAVISDTPSMIFQKFRIMVIEFHNLDRIFSSDMYPLIRGTFQKLAEHFAIVHIHPNNGRPVVNYKNFGVPKVMEFTFFRKDRFSESKPINFFPHELDEKNEMGNRDYILPECWWK